MKSNQVRAGVISLALAVSMLGTAGPANAIPDNSTEMTTPSSVLAEVPAHDIVDADPASSVDVKEEVSELTHKVQLETPALEQSTSLTIDNGSSFDGSKDGFAVFHDDEDDSTTMVRASNDGGQVIFAANSKTGLQDFKLEFDKNIEDTTDLGNGEVGVRFVDGTSIAVQEPWARDGQGRTLATTLEFSDNAIIQNVEVPKNASYPVVADPAWKYAYSYNLYKKNPYKVRALMKKPGKFSAIFPVSGAPKNFPTKNQKLPLKVAGMNFACTFQKEFWSDGRSGRNWGYQFAAAKGHVDGIGSTIKFSIVETAILSGNPGENRLWVDAYIKNDKPGGVPRSVYKNGAYTNWSGFAAKIRAFA
ncbi:hypothetical protein [Paeniglutamicibacter terrestris]|uniref:Uncharacterized protein n=1 Tax=Paeniglutamicibacter terrestris TaxID=2723403 RepID=A0ABX1FYV3_9MICC|nr:hypothetical protein [Paeniglutamicibacter terrestris]NKG19124.1 hypothetical protein [Paeniglutamicibacter terrestris]